jgi:hypothetical protein
VQCLGDNQLQVVEYRKVYGNNYHHYILGGERDIKQGWLGSLMERLTTRGKDPKNNEILDTEKTMKIFKHFYETKVVPKEFLLRDITRFF